MGYEIAIYKAEKEAGLAKDIQVNASVAYIVPIEPVATDSDLAKRLNLAFASHNQSEGSLDFDLYFLRDVLASTGWNKNKDVFDRVEAWVARHTPEHKPFNFEHKPLDIIGHITSSYVVDDEMNSVADDTAIDELPSKFHIINGSVLYMALADEERKKLMEQTVAEIKRGEWYVSMECLFKGFDYGVIGPDGSSRVIARNEESAFLTKYLSKYGGPGVYKCPSTGMEFTLGRVLRNIVFSGKGLVRKPANPESIIINTTAAFVSTPADLGYLTILPSQSKASESKIEESSFMAETTATVPVSASEQVLKKQLDDLQVKLDSVTSELNTVKSKDTETTIANLRKDVSDRDTNIAERDQTITSLNAQLEAIKTSQKTLTDRTEKAEADLKTANDELFKVKATEKKRERETVLRQHNAPAESIATLVDQFVVLDDTAFAKTVETISVAWKKPTTTKTDPAKTAISNAKPQDEPALATSSDDTDGEQARASEITSFFSKSLASARTHVRKSE